MRRILLLDCDQFFVQCARLEDPEGAGRESLLLVGGSAEGRGVVTSASYETRAFGVRSGMPTATALRLCPQAKVVGVPRELCGIKSREVRTVLQRFAPVVEAASIDEAYLDLTGTEGVYRNEPLEETARRIRETVLAETSIQTSIGGGTSKVIAKLAVSRAKPAGVFIVAPGDEQTFMATLPLAKIPGIGPVFQEELALRGLRQVAEAQSIDEKGLIALFGEGRGRWMYRIVRGIDVSPVESGREARSMSRDETFARDIDRTVDLERELLALTTRLGNDLRTEGFRARTVTVRLRDADFRTRQASRTLAAPVESDRGLYAVARDLLAKLRADRRIGARLIGVSASNFTGSDGVPQLGLFAGEETGVESDRDRRLSRASDDVRARFGADVLKPGRLLE
ncbi:MAG TPA: DNA polymerase IV [Longimicrobiales bacterium]